MLENPRTKLEKKTLLFYYLEISFKRFIHHWPAASLTNCRCKQFHRQALGAL